MVGVLCGLGAAAIWGGMYVVSKVVLEVIPPFALLSTRLLLGAAVLGLVLVVRKKALPRGRLLASLLGVGLLGYGLSLGLQFTGTRLSTAAGGSLVTSATPAFIVVFAAVILKERISTRQLIALVLAGAGVVAVVDPLGSGVDRSHLTGNLLLVGAALTWALYSVLVRRYSRSLGTVELSLASFLGGLPVAVPAGAAELVVQGAGSVGPDLIAGVLYLGVVSTAGAMLLWNTALARTEAAVVSLTFFAQPVVGGFLGWLLLGETITPMFLAGAALIGTGLAIGAARGGVAR